MTERQFVHLHVHTQYSLLDGAIRVKALMARCKELGMPAVAMTDHGNMYGAVDFQKAAQAAGVKPIIGCEVYVAEGRREEFDSRKGFHLTLLAKNLVGYRNLTKIVSMAWLTGRHPVTGDPRADMDLIAENAEGLICLSGDLGSPLSQAVLRDQDDQAVEIAEKLRGIFEPGQLFLELIDAPLPEYKKVRRGLIELGEKTGLPLVATNDCHYLHHSDALAHAILMCIQLGKSVDPEKVLEHGLDTLYLKSADEMWEANSDVPDACENTLRIAEMIDLVIPLGEIFLPRYQVPADFEAPADSENPDAELDAYFAHIAQLGLRERFDEFDRFERPYDEADYRERLEEEIGIIQSMKFSGYFLIVWDFINYAKKNGVPVGPGRGSGAGSLVAYSLGITDIDPIPYGLLFERFLNPERVSMPDFDIDFCMNRRAEVIDYVTRKYGEHNVGQIITYGQLKARACIKDVGRALGLTFAETDRIAKLIPDELGITLKDALEKEPRLGELMEEQPLVATLFDIALRLENLNRQAGIHAAGLVISEKPIWEYVPICLGSNDELVTQFAKSEVEEAGLVKFDFLGLKTLTVIDIAIGLINANRAADDVFDIRGIPMDDSEVFKMISKGDTTGVFQLESSGFQTLLQKLRPDCFEHIIAAVALYRPGPLGAGMVDDFIACRHGRQAVKYPHPWLEDILRETYGAIVYQEQVMKIAQIMAGYTLGGADLLRRAMGKKKPEAMAKQKTIFIEGAQKRGIDGDKAESIFDLMAHFAGYGFNKSHSAAYALITYQTGYLKVHYPVEFMAALMTCDRENTDKVVRFIHEANGMGVQVLPPDVNESGLNFTAIADKIRFGLGAIKGVGTSAIEVVLEAKDDGPFTSIYDFCERVDLKRVNRRVIEAMIKSGAFDSVGLTEGEASIIELAASRAKMFAAVDPAMSRGQKAQRDREAGQASLFGMFAAAAPTDDGEDFYPDADPWTDKELLSHERASVGFYLTGHPLDRYKDVIKSYATHNTETLAKAENHEDVQLACVVSSIRERISKTGKRMAFLEVEDDYGTREVLCFNDAYAEAEPVLKSDAPILVVGTVRLEGDEALTHKIRLKEAKLLTDVRKQRMSRVLIRLDAAKVEAEQMHSLAEILKRFPGTCETELTVKVKEDGAIGQSIMTLSDDFRVDPSDEMLFEVERLFGDRVVSLR